MSSTPQLHTVFPTGITEGAWCWHWQMTFSYFFFFFLEKSRKVHKYLQVDRTLFESLKPLNHSAQCSVFQPDLAINKHPTRGFVFGLAIQLLKTRHGGTASGCPYFFCVPFPPRPRILSSFFLSIKRKTWSAWNRWYFKRLHQ